MAMGVNSSGARGRRGRRGARGSFQPMSDINVTPMVDVMLVLLIVFMVTAPLLTVGVQVNLPKAEAPTLKGSDEPLVISIKADGQVYLQDAALALEQLAPRLRAITENKPDTRIFVRGDEAIAYGRIMSVMGTLNAAGFSKVALIAEMPRPAGGIR